MQVKVGTMRSLCKTVSNWGSVNVTAETKPALFIIPDGKRMTRRELGYMEGYEQGVQDCYEYLKGIKE